MSHMDASRLVAAAVVVVDADAAVHRLRREVEFESESESEGESEIEIEIEIEVQIESRDDDCHQQHQQLYTAHTAAHLSWSWIRSIVAMLVRAHHMDPCTGRMRVAAAAVDHQLCYHMAMVEDGVVHSRMIASHSFHTPPVELVDMIDSVERY